MLVARHSLFWWVDIICHGLCGNKSPALNEGPQRNKVLIKIALSLMQEVVWDVGHSLTLWTHYLRILTAHLANCCRASNNFSDVTAQGSFLTPDGHKFQDGKIFRGTIASQENDVKLLALERPSAIRGIGGAPDLRKDCRATQVRLGGYTAPGKD